MRTGAQSAAESLALLEADFCQYVKQEQQEICLLREALRRMVEKYGTSAELAIFCTGFEIAIRRDQ